MSDTDTNDDGERASRMAARFDQPEDSEPESKPSKTDKTSEPDKTGGEDEVDPVKEWPSALWYLPDELMNEMDARFDELNAAYRREFGQPIEKNRDFRVAVARVGLGLGESLEDELGLTDDGE